MDTILQPIFYAVFIFILVLFFVFWRPNGLSIGWPPAIGALLALLFGVVTLTNLYEIAARTWDAVLSLIALVLLALSLYRVGWFEWAAIQLVRLSRGNGRLMFVYICLLTGLVAAFFSAYASMIVLTPVVIAIAHKINGRGTDPAPFIAAVGFMSAAAALPLTVSHPLNMLATEVAQVGMGQFAIRMSLSFVVALAVSALALTLLFMRRVPAVFSVPTLKHPLQAIRDQRGFTLSWIIMAIIAIGYVFGDLIHLPASFIVMPAALFHLLVARGHPDFTLKEIMREVPWPILAYIFGIALLVYGLIQADLALYLTDWLGNLTQRGPFLTVIGTGFAAAIVSALMQQIPATLLFTEAIVAAETSGLLGECLFYAQLIGAHYGQLLAPFGSIVAFLSIYQKIGEDGRIFSDGKTYIWAGLALSLPILALTLSALYVVLIGLHG